MTERMCRRCLGVGHIPDGRDPDTNHPLDRTCPRCEGSGVQPIPADWPLPQHLGGDRTW
jgi:DnaJ-class molecular chaperone